MAKLEILQIKLRPSSSQIPNVFYHSVIYGFSEVICFMRVLRYRVNVAENDETRYFYVLFKKEISAQQSVYVEELTTDSCPVEI